MSRSSASSRSSARSHRARPDNRAPLPIILLRLGGVALLMGILFAGFPPLRQATQTVSDTFVRATVASRLADHQVALRYSGHYGIPFDLAADIQRIAASEGIDPELAFRLVRIESGFREQAVSAAGALGLTQVMPTTAEALDPGISAEAILERETNLRLGFRYLRWLLEVYDGNVSEALHAYNRGPGTVARIRSGGGDPANGYADRVLRGQAPGIEAYTGPGVLNIGPGVSPTF